MLDAEPARRPARWTEVYEPIRSPRKNSSAMSTTAGMTMDLDDTERELNAR